MSIEIQATEEEIKVFLEECEEKLQILENGLILLEKESSNHRLLNNISRAAHTLKGSSSVFGHKRMVHLTHSMETILDMLRKNTLQVNTYIIDVLLESLDKLKILRSEIISQQESEIDINPVIEKLKNIIEGKVEVEKKEEKIEIEEKVKKIEKIKNKEEKYKTANYNITVIFSKDSLSSVRAFQVINSLTRFGNIITTIPSLKEIEDGKVKAKVEISFESQLEKEKIEKIISEIGDIEKIDIIKIEERKEKLTYAPKKEISKSVRIDVERLDNLMNLVGELIVDSSHLREVSNIFEDKFEEEKIVKELIISVEHLNRITEDLQSEVMKSRLLPISTVFNKFPRMVRDLSLKAKKEINFQIFGEETELDRSIIEEISDPLIHVIRNAIDHGIEAPDIREKLGKPKEGNIKLSARHEEMHVVITIEDDGAGISTEFIKEKAIKKGIISAESADKLNEKEIIELIFKPGFSTKDEATTISGRGIGMDIVKANIEKLQGSVLLETKEGEGSKFIIKLPLTLAIIRALLVSHNKEIYAIPISQVLETLRIRTQNIQTVRKKDTILFRGEVLPIIKIEDALNLRLRSNSSKKFLRIVVVKWYERKIGLVVDSLIGDQEIVIKSLGNYVGEIPGISGATILGDGKVALILDIPNLVKKVVEEQI